MVRKYIKKKGIDYFTGLKEPYRSGYRLAQEILNSLQNFTLQEVKQHKKSYRAMHEDYGITRTTIDHHIRQAKKRLKIK